MLECGAKLTVLDQQAGLLSNERLNIPSAGPIHRLVQVLEVRLQGDETRHVDAEVLVFFVHFQLELAARSDARRRSVISAKEEQ